MKIEYKDGRGQLHTDILEGYTLGYDYSNQQILKGFRWASNPGPWFSKGRSNYDVERITDAELTGHKFGSPFDESGAKDSSEFRHIVCDYYTQGKLS